MENPQLKNCFNERVIEINSSPFTIGRGLSCNYVIPIQSISRVHCKIEKVNGTWILQDTSTNGTCVNGIIIKSDTSHQLENNDVIDLDREREKYIFQNSAPAEDITDEQLCRIADSLLSDVEIIPNTIEPNNKYSTDDGRGPSKRAKIVQSSELPNNITTSVIDLTNDSFRKSVNMPVDDNIITATASEAGPSKTEIEPLTKVESLNDMADKAVSVVQEQDNMEEMVDEMQCSICSEMFVKAVTLSCSHTFCRFCIETWKKNNEICPICRTKITSITPTLVVDNIIEKMIQSSSEEVKKQRSELLEERKKIEEQNKVAPKPVKGRNRGRRGRGGGTSVTGRTDNVVAWQILQTPPPINQSVIELSSSSSDSDDSTFTDTDEGDWREEYETDDWYEHGDPGAYYGGYGHCYTCGRQGHWANGCPYR